jgi:hypothetical protein
MSVNRRLGRLEDPTEESENEWCSTCGRQLTYDVWWPEDLEQAKLPPPPRE